MPEILPDHVPSPRTFLAWDGTRYRACSIDAAGQLQVDVIASGLPAGAATAAAQALALAQLQLIEDMRDALQSVATDRLIVRGEDQLFSINRAIATTRTAVISGAGGFVDSTTVPAGVYWIIRLINAVDITSPTTAHYYIRRFNAATVDFYPTVAARAAWDISYWNGFLCLEPGDTVRVTFVGALAGDSCRVNLLGYEITIEV